MNFQEVYIESLERLDRLTDDVRVRLVEPDEDGKYEGDEFHILFVEFGIGERYARHRPDAYLFAAYFIPAINDLSYHLGELESVEVRTHPRARERRITCFDFRQHRLPFMCSSRWDMPTRRTVIRFELYFRKTN